MMTPEELERIEQTVERGLYVTDEDAGRLVAEVRRLTEQLARSADVATHEDGYAAAVAELRAAMPQELAPLQEALARCNTACDEAKRKADDHRRLYEASRAEIDRLRAELAEVVICAAIRMPDGYIVRGHRHCDCIATAHVTPRYAMDWECPYGDDQGFVTSRNRYVTREEGLALQLAAGIPSADPSGYRKRELFSEDLY